MIVIMQRVLPDIRGKIIHDKPVELLVTFHNGNLQKNNVFLQRPSCFLVVTSYKILIVKKETITYTFAGLPIGLSFPGHGLVHLPKPQRFRRND